MDFLEWLGVPANVEVARKAAQSVIETGIASALGNFELDETKILAPLKTAMHDIVADALAQADKWVDKQLKKVRIGEQG